jgi:3-oxoacyl-[acyl-carrier protein] reductase
VAVVTGGGGDIGAAVVRRLCEAGGAVVVVDRDGDRAQEAADAAPGDALAVCADVSTKEGVDAYINAALSRFGRLDFSTTTPASSAAQAADRHDRSRSSSACSP